jgi:XTP/dITP diphosphohydrolase
LDRIIIASMNPGKLREIRSILALDGVNLQDLGEVGFNEPIEETGSSFDENALIKAAAVYRRYHAGVVADDSGLVVPFLNGEPGVRSARYGGPGADDQVNNRILLEKLVNATGEERKAWFACVAVFYHGEGLYLRAEGRVEGYVAAELQGDRGFGYDPLFYLPDLGKTMAQLSDNEKNSISHRGTAFRKLKEEIETYLSHMT